MARRVDRGTGQAVRDSLARRRLRSVAGRAARPSAASAGASSPRKADRLLIAPQDLRTADAHPRERNLCRPLRLRRQGRDLRRPLAVRDRRRRPRNGRRALLGFGWLRHLRAAESGITRANARALVDEWIALQGSLAPDRPGGRRSWRGASSPGSARRRWSCTTPTCSSIAASCAASRARSAICATPRCEARDGVPRLQALIALTYAALCMAGQARHMRSATKQLVDELERQILPDGGHISRNPGALIELLLDLLPLRQAFAARNIAPPPQLHQRHRPHDADAALLPARRRQLRAFQRHGPDAARSDRHHPRL